MKRDLKTHDGQESGNMIMGTKIIGISILLLMLLTYLSFFAGMSFWYHDFLAFLRYIEFPDSGWHLLDIYIYNGAL